MSRLQSRKNRELIRELIRAVRGSLCRISWGAFADPSSGGVNVETGLSMLTVEDGLVLSIVDVAVEDALEGEVGLDFSLHCSNSQFDMQYA